MKHPSQHWAEYRELLPDDLELTPLQEQQIRLAFHAGAMSTFKAVEELAKEDPKPSNEEFAEMLRWFRRHNAVILLAIAIKDK